MYLDAVEHFERKAEQSKDVMIRLQFHHPRYGHHFEVCKLTDMHSFDCDDLQNQQLVEFEQGPYLDHKLVLEL